MSNRVDDFPRAYASSQRFTAGHPRNLKLGPGRGPVTFLRPTKSGSAQLALWAIDPVTGAETLLADPAALGIDDSDLPVVERERRERAREGAAGIVAYSLDPLGEKACFALGGELFVTEIATGTTVAMKTPGSVFDPRFSPADGRIAFASGQSLYLTEEGPDSGSTPIVESKDPLVSWGRAEFIAGEEMDRTAGYWWAPDGSGIIASRVDVSAVPIWWIADPASPQTPPRENRYPAAGTTNAEVQLHLFPVPMGSGASKAIPIPWADDRRFEYLTDLIWEKGHAPLVVRQNRDQTLLDLATVDPTTGELVSRHQIMGQPWVEQYPGSPTWWGDRLVTVEDRDNHRTIVVDGSPLPLPGWQVRSIESINGSEALVTAWKEPSEIYLLAVDLRGRGVRLLSTSAGVSTGSTNGSLVMISSSSLDWAGPRITVHGASDEPVELTSLAAEPPITAKPTFVRLGSSQLNSAILFPSWHDGTSPLPVLLDPYAGPHAQRVLRSHNSHLVSQWFAELGFAVLVVDGRGTPGRGPRWEHSVHGNLADPVLADQIDALDAAAAKYPFLDLDRVGIRGWSFGGFLAALAVLERPDRFHAAVAGAPVTDWPLYDTHYTERYLGHPKSEPEAYLRSGLLHRPARWDHATDFPPLLIIHGLADDNVVAAHTLQLSSALLAAGLSHQVLPLTGVTHMTPQAVVAENLLRIQARFLVEALRPVGPQSEGSQ